MSYLIGLYVYYHGNNLAMFGFVKGSKEIENQNKGMKQFNEVEYREVLPEKDVEILKNQEMVRQENNYEAMMREAIIRAQQESVEMSRKGLIQNKVIDSTPDGLIDEAYDGGEIGLSFFDELNGF